MGDPDARKQADAGSDDVADKGEQGGAAAGSCKLSL